MDSDILIEVSRFQTRLALMEDGELAEFYIEKKGGEKLSGNIYMGRVANILPGMQAAFVDIGMGKNAFLYAGDIQIDKKDFGDALASVENQLKSKPIQKMLKSGQELLVQVTKEPGGEKGPRITNNITLPGRMTVLLPTVSYVGISHRIEDEAERARLRELAERLKPEGMGLIVRTAALGACAEEIERDIEALTRLWQSICKRSQGVRAPAELHRDESLVYRSVRDMLGESTRALLIDDPAQYAFARETAETLSPELVNRIALYADERPLFDAYRVDSRAEKALSRKVWLKSGGYLIFDYAEALTVIDVNTGKFVGSHSLSDTVFAINCEAASEIAKQLRLRDIGGIIVIDFIDMDKPEQREQLVSLLRMELKRDRTKTNVVGLTGLGLVEMTRKKMHQPVRTQLMRACPYCQGSGVVPTDESVAYAALRDLRLRSTSLRADAWLICAQPLVAAKLMELGEPKDVCAFVKADTSLAFGEYRVEPADIAALPAKARRMGETEANA